MEDIIPGKLRMSLGSMFRPAFASCSSRKLSDVVEKSVLHPRRNSFQSLPSKCRATSPIEPLSRSGPISIPKAPEDGVTAFTLGDVLKGRLYRPSVSLASPPKNHFHDRKNHKQCEPLREYRWYSSDDEKEEEEDETDTLFSSKSFVSSSSGSRQQQRLARRRRRRRRKRSRSEVGVLPMDSEDGNGIEGSFAVVKKSSDPHGDFRKSMVEMIVEKQIFGAQELEKLLKCFLSLNSHHHHNIILQVFTEIWEAFFPHHGIINHP
ncbi:hypothetical protein SAY86_025848 [Trapa natans]|uniref:Transcription repressor n=1 Tax=Trapa natans TaxID=22666 RepID=A0AAN7K9V3_TRANT|nr:hypothetical protein SAY86_025848 [Trapa natans]